MAYSDFTLPEVTRRFQLTFDEQHDLFARVGEIAPSEALRMMLDENVPLALAIQTEKARSEFIIAPILLELRRIVEKRISLFSGVDFTVDPAQGLNGVCDYIVSRSREQLFIRAPIIIIIEAKNENIKAGIAQCTAALVAAQLFNEREGTGISTAYGIVTTGNIWRFLKFEGRTVSIDHPEYYIDNIGSILAILAHIVEQYPTYETSYDRAA
jgi:hypothetical protein